MWVFFVILALLLLTFSRVRLSFFAAYADEKLALKLSLGLAFGLVPLYVKAEYAHGRVRYELPWIEVDESLERFAEDIIKVRNTAHSGKIRFPIQRILARSSISKFKLYSTIGVRDAAVCALLCGLLNVAVYALLAPLKWKKGAFPVIEVVPAFNRREFSLKLEGIAWILPAQIIFEGNHKASFKVSAGG